MKDLKQVIEEINRVQNADPFDAEATTDVLTDALALLKEQEPVKPDSFMDGRVKRFACKKCGKHLLYAKWGRDNYCSKCGKPVKWE